MDFDASSANRYGVDVPYRILPHPCKAISDLEITPHEYNKIMHAAQDDGYLDKEEKALLAQFHEMLNNGTIKRVRG